MSIIKHKPMAFTPRAFIALCSLIFPAGPLFSAPSEKSNVLIMMVDDMGYADLGVQGCTDIPTPHIDSIAKNGVCFTNGYVNFRDFGTIGTGKTWHRSGATIRPMEPRERNDEERDKYHIRRSDHEKD